MTLKPGAYRVLALPAISTGHRSASMKILLFANTAWYLFNFRRSLAEVLRAQGHEVILASPPDPYGEKLRALGFRWEPVPMERRSINPWRELSLILWLARLMRRERLDLVHSFTIKCVIYGSIAARLAGVRARVGAAAGMGYVFTRHTPGALALRAVATALMRLALGGRRVRLIVQNPDDLAFFVETRLMPRESVTLIPSSGVDGTRFHPADAEAQFERRARTGFRVLLPARLLWDKGVAEYMEAARYLRAAGRHDIHFLLAGSPDPGNPTAVPESDIRGWAEEGLIEWLGHVEDMPTLLRSVDVVALPSYREGLPKGLIEAGASGLPLVTTDVPGCREVVTHELNGLLVPVRNGAALADAVVRLRDDPALSARLGAAARQACLERFDERRVISDTLEVYRALTAVADQDIAVVP